MTNNPTKFAIVNGAGVTRRFLTVSGGWHPNKEMAWTFETGDEAEVELNRVSRRNVRFLRVIQVEG